MAARPPRREVDGVAALRLTGTVASVRERIERLERAELLVSWDERVRQVRPGWVCALVWVLESRRLSRPEKRRR